MWLLTACIGQVKSWVRKLSSKLQFELNPVSITTINVCLKYLYIFLFQKRHYRSDWHRYNLKQRLKGRERISEEQFEEISGTSLSLWLYIFDELKLVIYILKIFVLLCLNFSKVNVFTIVVILMTITLKQLIRLTQNQGYIMLRFIINRGSRYTHRQEH